MKYNRIIKALKSEWLFVIGTILLIGQWSVDRWLISDEEEYAEWFRDETNLFHFRLMEYRNAVLRYELIMFNQDKFKSDNERKVNKYGAKMENVLALNQSILALKSRGVQKPDSTIYNDYLRTMAQIDVSGAMKDTAHIDFVYDSLRQQMAGSQQLANVREPEFAAMEARAERITKLKSYKWWKDAFFILGTIFVTLNTFIKYWQRNKNVVKPLDNNKIIHTLSEISKNSELILAKLRRK